MAKRARGSSSRPGQRAPIQRSSARPTTGAPPTGAPSTIPTDPAALTDAEIARASALEAQIVAQEQAAERAAAPSADQGARRTQFGARGSTLAAGAVDEYAYVARDVRRITLIGGSLVAVLFGGWALIQVTGVSLF